MREIGDYFGLHRRASARSTAQHVRLAVGPRHKSPQTRYIVYCTQQQPIALLGFGAAAWMCAPRDRYIGWTHEQRRQHLHLIVNNARFLILPWVRSKHLASMILA